MTIHDVTERNRAIIDEVTSRLELNASKETSQVDILLQALLAIPDDEKEEPMAETKSKLVKRYEDELKEAQDRIRSVQDDHDVSKIAEENVQSSSTKRKDALELEMRERQTKIEEECVLQNGDIALIRRMVADIAGAEESKVDEWIETFKGLFPRFATNETPSIALLASQFQTWWASNQ